jgi:release factor glutamine methyltransferase
MQHENLLMNNNRELTALENDAMQKVTERRLGREPVSRILGVRAFWRSDFKISKETLDPRPDSETLIETVLRYTDKNRALNILDLGTGTGCLLLSLLQEFPKAKGFGIDISEDAILTAKANAEALALSSRSSFMKINWKDFKTDTPFDIIISNPPYIAESEIPHLEPEVREYDPIPALLGGKDGLDCYREIAARLPKLLAKDGHIFFEIGFTQAKQVASILAEYGLCMIETRQDLAGQDRCVVASMRSSVSDKEKASR